VVSPVDHVRRADDRPRIRSTNAGAAGSTSVAAWALSMRR